jgi:hypothetical protein
MKRFKLTMLAALWLAAFAALEADADIYSWTDENGVRYFTNYAPPKQAKIIMRTPEIAYDAEADLQRRESDALEVARQELAEREAFLLQQQQAAERRIAEANARAEATIREADRILQDAEAAAEDAEIDHSSNYAYRYYTPYYGYRYPRKIHYKDSHYYYYGGLHHKKHPYKHKPSLYKQFVRKFSVDRYQNAFGGRAPSHRERVTTFRGRHGRF